MVGFQLLSLTCTFLEGLSMTFLCPLWLYVESCLKCITSQKSSDHHGMITALWRFSFQDSWAL